MSDVRVAGEEPNRFALSLSVDRCPHRYAQREGCRRCIDACRHGAIAAGVEIPRLDTSKCLDCGVCAAVCPTGALQSLTSPVQTLLLRLRDEILRLSGKSGRPIVAFYDPASGLPESLKTSGKPLACLGVTSFDLVGMESLLSAFAFGASGVIVLAKGRADERERGRLSEEVQLSLAVLTALGFADDCIRILGIVEAPAALQDAPTAVTVPPASYAVDQPKRLLIRLAAEHLSRHSPNPQITLLPLPSGAPFGSVAIQSSACTLCMACAGACKMKALSPITGATAGLQFVEANCIQCGLCAQICPEKALSLIPRLNLQPAAAAFTILHQEEPARCRACGRPFASHQMIAAIQRKLQGHWMYEGSSAQARLSMCDRCRVQDIFTSQKRE